MKQSRYRNLTKKNILEEYLRWRSGLRRGDLARRGKSPANLFTLQDPHLVMTRRSLCSLLSNPDAKVACQILVRKKQVWLSDLVQRGMTVPRARRALSLLERRGLADPIR